MFKYLLILFVTLSMQSCKKDESRTSIQGSWNCDEFSDIEQRIYQVSIIRNHYLPNDSNEYIINNFYNLGITESSEVYVREVKSGELKITGTAAIGYSFIGTGVISDNFSRIEWTYQVNDGINNPNIRANYY